MSDLEKLSLTLDQMADIKSAATYGADYAGRVSFGFAVRLLMMRENLGEDRDILNEVDALEGIKSHSSTKEAEQFKHAPLHPFWHKHFMTSRHFAKNFGLRWGLDKNGNRDLTKMIENVATRYGDKPGLWQGVMAHKLVIGGIEDRAASKRLTGDWIIFSKHHGKNYYLDIASHEEGYAPDQLMSKLKGGSFFEFPFLFSGTM